MGSNSNSFLSHSFTIQVRAMTMEKTLRTDMVHISALEEVLLNCISSDMVSSGERESLI